MAKIKTKDIIGLVGSDGKILSSLLPIGTGVATPTATSFDRNSLQNAIEAASVLSNGVGRVPVIFNNIVTISDTSIYAKSNVELVVPIGGFGQLKGTMNQPCLELHGVVKDFTYTRVDFLNTVTTTTGAATLSHAGCVQSYPDALVTNPTFDVCNFSVPNANMNAISLAPYSKFENGGQGLGNMFTGLLMKNCTGSNIGRGFFEVTSHAHEIQKKLLYFKNATFVGNVLSNLGTKSNENPLWGAGWSLSGWTWGCKFLKNKVTNCKYAIIEGVAAENLIIDGLEGDSTNTDLFAAIGLSATRSDELYIKCKNVRISNVYGYATGRTISAQDVDGLITDTSVATSSARNSFDRVSGLEIRNVVWMVSRGTQYNTSNNEGGCGIYIKDCPGILIENFDFSLTHPTETNFAVLVTDGSTTGVIRNGIVSRPDGGNNLDTTLNTRNTPGVTVTNVIGA